MESRFWEAQDGRVFVGRLATGSDLVTDIQAFCEAEDIRAAWVSLVGAVTKATFGYYEQHEHRYIEMTSDFHHEISGFIGNISMREGKPFLHAHATFGEHEGGTLGGHLLPGCTVFVGEVTIREMTGVELTRTPDEVTGLALW
ncbi:MAG TPA: PPC domain-containing DNA-binding protein [Candidatus Limnocylindria bacterium]|nr:PPC domain-containing DNA-binding protein [Candidatus Limnocylindria bacterium]